MVDGTHTLVTGGAWPGANVVATGTPPPALCFGEMVLVGLKARRGE